MKSLIPVCVSARVHHKCTDVSSILDRTELGVNANISLAQAQMNSPQLWLACAGEIDSEHLAVQSRWPSAG